MHVTVFGAAGKTGTLVTERAMIAGHRVTAFVRSRKDFTLAERTSSITVVEGDALDVAAVAGAMENGSAVIDCIGGTTPFKHTELERNTAATIVKAMQQTGATRLIAISMMGVGDSREQTPFWYEHLFMPTFLRGATEDKTAMEAEVRESNLDFVLVRPPILSDDSPKGDVKVIDEHTTGHKITRGDLAQFLVDQLTSDTYLGKAVTVVNQ